MHAIKTVGGAFAAVALFAGMSVWFVVGMTHSAWVESSRPATRVRQPKPFSSQLGPIVTFATICVVFHVVTWLLRLALTRREQSLGMRSQFWTVLSAAAYGVGFIGGAFIYFTSPE